MKIYKLVITNSDCLVQPFERVLYLVINSLCVFFALLLNIYTGTKLLKRRSNVRQNAEDRKEMIFYFTSLFMFVTQTLNLFLTVLFHTKNIAKVFRNLKSDICRILMEFWTWKLKKDISTKRSISFSDIFFK